MESGNNGYVGKGVSPMEWVEFIPVFTGFPQDNICSALPRPAILEPADTEHSAQAGSGEEERQCLPPDEERSVKHHLVPTKKDKRKEED